jgi:hypothetical protein
MNNKINNTSQLTKMKDLSSMMLVIKDSDSSCDKKYQIVYNNTAHNITHRVISKSLDIGCELFEISNGPKYLGVISKKSIIYLYVEFLDFAFKNHLKIESSLLKRSIDTYRRFVEEPSSVSEIELIDLIKESQTESSRLYYMDIREKKEYSGYLDLVDASRKIIDIIRDIRNLDTINRYSIPYLVSESIHAIYLSNNKLLGKVNHENSFKHRLLEYERQSNFVIDFLSSGKYLFMGDL